MSDVQQCLNNSLGKHYAVKLHGCITSIHTRNILFGVLQVNPQCIWSPCDSLVLVGICVGESRSLSSLPSNQTMQIWPCLVLTTLNTRITSDMVTHLSLNSRIIWQFFRYKPNLLVGLSNLPGYSGKCSKYVLVVLRLFCPIWGDFGCLSTLYFVKQVHVN